MRFKTLIIVIQLISIVSLPLTVFSQKISDKDTSLLGAVKRDDFQLVKNLVSKGANVNFQDENGAPVLMWAAFNDDLQMVKYLVGKGALLNKKGTIDNGSFIFDNVLSIAVNNKNADLVYYLLDKCNCTITNNDIIFPIDKTTNEKHFDLNDFDRENQEDGYILYYLFFYGLDISIFDLINFEGTDWAVKDFLKHSPDSIEILDSLSRTLLHAASLNNRLTLAEYLLKEGAELDAIDDLGYTPYYLAKVEENTEMMDLLSDAGADTAIIPFDDEKSVIQEDYPEEDFESRIHLPLKPELILPYGHTDNINTVNYSNDGRLIITGSNDNTAKVWEASTGKLLYTLEKHTAWVQYAAFSPDMEFIVTQTLANKTYIWYTKTGQLIHEFNSDAFIHPFFSFDSKNIFIPFSYSFGKYDVFSGKLISIFKSHSDVINSLSVNNAGTLIVSASDDSTIKIWDAVSDKLIHTLSGINSKVELAEFSHNSKYILSSSENNIARLWSADTGNLLFTLSAQTAAITNLSFSPDDKYILTKSFDDTVRVWSTLNGERLYSIFHIKYNGIKVSDDNKFIFTQSDGKAFRIWDISTGKLLHTSEMDLIDVLYVPAENKIVLFSEDTIHTIETSFWKTLNKVKTESSITSFSKRLMSPDKQFFLQSYNHNEVFGIQIFNINSGKLSSAMFRHAYKIISADFNTSNDSLIIVTERGITIGTHNSHKMFQILSDYRTKTKSYLSPSKKIISISGNKRFHAYEISTGKNIIHQWLGSDISSVSYDPSGEKVAVSERNGVVYILECGTGKLLSKLKLPDKISCLSFSSNGEFLGVATFDGEIKLFRTTDFSEFKTLNGHTAGINSIEFSHNGKLCVTSSNDSTAKVWDIQTGELLSTLNTEGLWVSKAFFSSDDKIIITATSSFKREVLPSGGYIQTTTFGGNESWGRIKIWDSMTGKLISNLNGHTGGIEDIIFSPDGKYLLTGSSDNTAIIWDCDSRKLLFKLEGHTSRINSVRFSSDEKYVLTASNDSRVKIWDSSTGKEILSYIPIDSIDWVVLSPTGLFDASAGAMKQMYYVQGLDIIELDQLKDRYYEPNLWSKLMGLNTESLRDVKGLDEIKLFPSITLKIKDDNLNYTLTDQGGGIGKYMIYINGKETLTANLPEDSINFRGGKTITSTFSLKNHPYLIPGENEIMIKAFNSENYLVSRGEKVLYIPKGEIVSQKPKLFLITSGVSDYTGDQIDLRYASKDAEDMAKALELGANRLFGTESTYTFKLTSDNPDLKYRPTKANIVEAFNNVAKQAKASDILIVYISGHGINLGGQDGDFYYLTQDAYTSNINAYNDKVIRDKTTISSSEMTELIKKVPALKQVLIIDACGSGKTVENLIEKRDISSSTLRALDRMKDRTGLHIITGCAADAVSYEASKFGQGVLTYSLLEGILGASLRENKFIDVVKLFQYGRERVPELAKGFGGIQQPQIFSPYGESSFDIGEIETEDKSMINLAQAKFIVLMSSIKDKETFDDILGIEKIIDEKLREKSSADLNSPFVFVDAKDFPDAYKIRGQYAVSGNDVEVTINFFKGTIKKSSFVTKGVKTNLNDLSDLIINKLIF